MFSLYVVIPVGSFLHHAAHTLSEWHSCDLYARTPLVYENNIFDRCEILTLNVSIGIVAATRHAN